MLGVVVLAGLLPDAGVVSASSNCTYGKCPASSPFPIWAVSAAVVVVLLAVILALLLLRRGRGRPPSAESTEPEAPADPYAGSGTTDGSAQAWEEPPPTESGPGTPPAEDPPYEEGSSP